MPKDNNGDNPIPTTQFPLLGDADDNGVLETASEAFVNRVSIRTPAFCKDRPALWFASLEAQFFINKITQEATKFSFAVAHLDTNCTREVEDIIIQPPASMPYTTLKQAIIARFSESHEEKMRRLLEREHMGDRKPSSFLRHLKSLAGHAFPDDLMRSIWTGRLPRQLQIILAAQQVQDLGELAILADRLMDIQSQPPEVSSISSVTTPPTPDQSVIQALQKQMTELTQMVASLTATNRPPRDQQKSHNSSTRYRSRSRSRPRNEDLCWYHDRFAQKAKKCEQPCKWSGNLSSGQ